MLFFIILDLDDVADQYKKQDENNWQYKFYDWANDIALVEYPIFREQCFKLSHFVFGLVNKVNKILNFKNLNLFLKVGSKIFCKSLYHLIDFLSLSRIFTTLGLF